MAAAVAQVSLELPGGQRQEFDLARAGVLIGRALTNDIVLQDARVSRTHARLDCGPAGCSVVDLGSPNGTWVNGRRVSSAALAPGDVLVLGNSRLTFASGPLAQGPEVTVLDSDAELEATLLTMSLPKSLNEHSGPRLVVLAPDKTWEAQLEVDALSIGRVEDNDLALDFEKVSRHHARLEREGDVFILKDLDSTNGTWMGAERVEASGHRLKSGDSFRVGPVQLVFKGGFAHAALTSLETETFLPDQARRPVIIVPGVMGSELWLGSERVWPDVKHLFRNPELYRLPDETPLEPRGLVQEVVIVPNLIKLDQYNRLGDYLVEELGYERGADLLEFGYDWRQDVRLSARRLAEAIEKWERRTPITIIAHSLGTLVSRYYVERLGGERRVERLILMGGPHQGAPKAAASMVLGPNLLPFGLLGDRLRDVIATFPTGYQILPTYPCALDQDGQRVDLFAADDWLTEAQRPLIAAAREFRRELGHHSSVPSVSIFGYGLETVTGLRLQRGLGGALSEIKLTAGPDGDSTVPRYSSVLPGSEIHPVQQYHGSLFVDNDVKMRLKLELTRQLPQ
jgi:pSer/pThr/pTyr-binding forkhead associated (FHA) protein/pimeloyl-ACP methyl ester carboxylesterase